MDLQYTQAPARARFYWVLQAHSIRIRRTRILSTPTVTLLQDTCIPDIAAGLFTE